MAAILVFFCLIANWPFWPRSRLNIILNSRFESEAKWANLQGNKYDMVYYNLTLIEKIMQAALDNIYYFLETFTQ